jgi:hypothetical protein
VGDTIKLVLLSWPTLDERGYVARSLQSPELGYTVHYTNPNSPEQYRVSAKLVEAADVFIFSSLKGQHMSTLDERARGTEIGMAMAFKKRMIRIGEPMSHYEGHIFRRVEWYNTWEACVEKLRSERRLYKTLYSIWKIVRIRLGI